MGALAEQDVCQPVRSAQRCDKRLKNHDAKRKQGRDGSLLRRSVMQRAANMLADANMSAGVGARSHASAPQESWGSHARSSVTEAHEQRLEHGRRQEGIPRSHKDRPISVRGRLCCLKICRFCFYISSQSKLSAM